MTHGTLHGIGIGPGDPELITLKGLRLLEQIDLVFLPATAPGRSYAGTIAAPYLSANRQRIVHLVCPPYRDRSALVGRWTELAHDVAAELADGHDAAFLTEGDPSLYSTFQYLSHALRLHHPDVPIAIVPGVTSACAAAALAGMSLGTWDERLAIVPGTSSSESLQETLESFDTTVVLKPGAAMECLASLLRERGNALDVTLVRRAGRPEEAVLRGAEAIAQCADDYFSLLIARRVGQ